MSRPSPEASSPSRTRVELSYLIVILAGVAAWQIFDRTDPDPLLVDLDAFTVFAPFFIAALAIERFVEPFAALWNTTTEEKLELKEAKGAKEALEAAPVEDPAAAQLALQEADNKIGVAEQKLGKAQAQRAVPLWAVATTLGLLVSATLGLGLIAAVSATPPEDDLVRTLDILLTGLAVGAGTKPLHDLISRLEKAKENADPASKPAG